MKPKSLGWLILLQLLRMPLVDQDARIVREFVITAADNQPESIPAAATTRAGCLLLLLLPLTGWCSGVTGHRESH